MINSILQKEVIIWDNDGTIMGSKNPHDASDRARVILPNVQELMEKSTAIHIICSGCKTPESELQNFDPAAVIERFTQLMNKLPIQMALFSPAIGGTQCYIIIKNVLDNAITIRKAHEDLRYQQFIGQFKKPGIGMLMVIKDLLNEKFGIAMNNSNTCMIGDTWHDEHAARDVGIHFIDASHIHSMKALE